MPPSHNCRGGGGGYILLHTHDTDDSTPTVTGTGISAAHTAAIFTTFDQCLTKQVHNSYHTRILRFMTFLFKNYGFICKQCTIIVSPKDRLDASLYYSEKDIRDFTYSGLDPMYFLAFLSDAETKSVGNWHLTLTC